MTTDTNEALAGELRGFAALLQGHPDIEDQLIRLPGTSEVIDLREVLDTLSERVRQAADMLTAQAEKLAEAEAMKNVAYAAGYHQAKCGLPEHKNAAQALQEYRETKVKLSEAESDADRLAEALDTAKSHVEATTLHVDWFRSEPAEVDLRAVTEALAAHQKRRAG